MGISKTRAIKIDPCDKKWSQFVRERDSECLYCGHYEEWENAKGEMKNDLQAHHVIRRGISATRYDLDNGVSLCSKHHTFNNDFSAHRTEEKFRNWFKKTYPLRWKLINAKSKLYMTRLQAQKEFREMYNLWNIFNT